LLQQLTAIHFQVPLGSRCALSAQPAKIAPNLLCQLPLSSRTHANAMTRQVTSHSTSWF
jgi:hypothetical protein